MSLCMHPAGELVGESELVFSPDTANIAALLINSGPLPPGNYTIDVIAEPISAIPICVEDVIIIDAVGYSDVLFSEYSIRIGEFGGGEA